MFRKADHWTARSKPDIIMDFLFKVQPPCKVETNKMLSPFCTSYWSSPSSSQSASLMSTRMPGRLQWISKRMRNGYRPVATTYTVSSRTNKSFLGSFIVLLQRYLTRNATFAASPFSSLAGRAISCLRWLENSISKPPLTLSQLLQVLEYTCTHVNSTVMGTTPSLLVAMVQVAGRLFCSGNEFQGFRSWRSKPGESAGAVRLKNDCRSLLAGDGCDDVVADH